MVVMKNNVILWVCYYDHEQHHYQALFFIDYFFSFSLSLFDDDKNKDFVTCNQTGIRVHRSLWCDGRPDCSVFHEDELGCK